MCFAYEYTNQEDINCRIIHTNYLAGQTFVSNGTEIYLKGKFTGFFMLWGIFINGFFPSLYMIKPINCR